MKFCYQDVSQTSENTIKKELVLEYPKEKSFKKYSELKEEAFYQVKSKGEQYIIEY